MAFQLDSSADKFEGDEADASEEASAAIEGSKVSDDGFSSSFRPSYLEDSEQADGSKQSAPPPAGDCFFVTVEKPEGSSIHRFDGASEAQTFMEQLLEEGVPEGDVVAYSGRMLNVAVRHRPVVTIGSGSSD